jgi:hypothetical protein
MGLIDAPFLQRIRRNHAIEHATIHILGRRYPNQHIAGRSDTRGFYIYGDVRTEDVIAAADEALRVLDEHPEMAIHPMCGTNMVVGGVVAGLLSLAAVQTLPQERRTKPLEVLPRLILAGTAAMLASQPLGPAVQRRLTTRPVTDGVTVADVERRQHGRHTVHRVLLAEPVG